jgi:hypothetical protein
MAKMPANFGKTGENERGASTRQNENGSYLIPVARGSCCQAAPTCVNGVLPQNRKVTPVPMWCCQPRPHPSPPLLL